MINPDLSRIPQRQLQRQPTAMWGKLAPHKPKHDEDTPRYRSASLVAPQEIEFIATLPLEVCAAALQARSELGRTFRGAYPRLLIRVERVAAEQFDFYVEQDAGSSIIASARGTLTRLQEETTDRNTLVQGLVYGTRAPLLNALAATTFFCGLFLFCGMTHVAPAMLLTGLLLVWMAFRTVKTRQQQVAYILYRALAAEKQKRSGSMSLT